MQSGSRTLTQRQYTACCAAPFLLNLPIAPPTPPWRAWVRARPRAPHRPPAWRPTSTCSTRSLARPPAAHCCRRPSFATRPRPRPRSSMLFVFHTPRRLLPCSSLSKRRLLTVLITLADLHPRRSRRRSLPAVGGGHTGVLSVGAVPCSRKRLPLARFPSQGARPVIGSLSINVSSSDAHRSYDPHVRCSRLRM